MKKQETKPCHDDPKNGITEKFHEKRKKKTNHETQSESKIVLPENIARLGSYVSPK